MSSKQKLELVIAQFTGYDQAKRGQPINQICESMHLTKGEWFQIRNDIPIASVDKAFIDAKYGINNPMSKLFNI